MTGDEIMTKQYRDSIVIGLALFAMFFGAGNLIFPPSIGINAGNQWLSSMIGFFITGIGLPLLGILASVKGGEALRNYSHRIGKNVLSFFIISIVTTIGLVAIPRTAATTFEMGIQPLFPSFSPVISSILFFGVTLILAIKPTGIVDRIGKVLTPILVGMLSIIIIKGIINPIGDPISLGSIKSFTNGFVGGYQTMDALGAIIFGGIVINSLKEKGYNTTKDQFKMTIKAGLIASLGLAIVYGGLLFLGATSSSIFSLEIPRTELTINIASGILGNVGTIILGIAVSSACLTTSIGLVATIADFMSDISKGKLNYKFNVIVISIISGLIANLGVDTIVTLATPILVTLYPVAIVLIITSLLEKYIKYDVIYRGSIIGALVISLIEGLGSMGIEISYLKDTLNKLPLNEFGLAWITPAILGGIIALIIGMMKEYIGNKKIVSE